MGESSFTDKQQNDAILAELFNQKVNSMFCDVIMKVCGQEIHAHSAVLAAASPIFSTFLSQGFTPTVFATVPTGKDSTQMTAVDGYITELLARVPSVASS